MSKPTVISLFSGGGGWELGLRKAGFKPIKAVEFEPWKAGIYAANFGNHVINEALQKGKKQHVSIDWEKWPSPDVLTISPPCKLYVGYGKNRQGTGKKKHAIKTTSCPEVGMVSCAAAEVLRPKVILLENVPGYMNDPKSPLSRILACWQRLGYTITPPCVYDFSYFGVPMNRKRMIVAATLNGSYICPQPVGGQVSWDRALGNLITKLPKRALAPAHAYHLAHKPPPSYPALIRAGYDSRATIKQVWREKGQPSPSIAASSSSSWRVMPKKGDSRELTIEAVERLFGWPHSYDWNGVSRARAVDVMANSVPPPFAYRMGLAVKKVL